MDMVLEADSIYFSAQGRDILGGAYLRCDQGTTVGLLGRNGSGKSTLLQIVFGTLRADSSFVRIGGRVLTGRAYTSGLIRMMSQTACVPKPLRVATLLRMEGLTNEVTTDPLIQQMKSLRVGQLSGGQYKYLMVYILLHSVAPFIILDEPFAALSPIMTERVAGLIRRAQSTKGIVLSDHHYAMVSQLAQRLIYIDGGRCHDVDDIAELRGTYYR